MTVAELIQLLQQYDQELPVMMPVPDVALDPVGGAHIASVAKLANFYHMSGRYTDELRDDETGFQALILDADQSADGVETMSRRAARITTMLPVLKQGIESIDGVELAFVFGSFARDEARPTSDIDIMLIGDIDYRQLLRAEVELSADLIREVNPISYTRSDWEAGRKAGHGFIHRVLQQPIVMLKGEL